MYVCVYVCVVCVYVCVRACVRVCVCEGEGNVRAKGRPRKHYPPGREEGNGSEGREREKERERDSRRDVTLPK